MFFFFYKNLDNYFCFIYFQYYCRQESVQKIICFKLVESGIINIFNYNVFLREGRVVKCEDSILRIRKI